MAEAAAIASAAITAQLGLPALFGSNYKPDYKLDKQDL
jgi:hypothetical protein